MPLWQCLKNLWRNLFNKSHVEQELSEEVQGYLDMLIEMKVKGGIKAEEARRAALIEMGGIEQTKESVREVRMGHQLETLWQDLRYGMRMLMKSPGFTAAALLTLALGIGANTAIFSVVNAVLLRQLPFKEPERLVWLWSIRAAQETNPFSIPYFIDCRDQNRTLEQLSATGNWSANLTNSGEPERVQGVRITANAFETLGVNALLGRTLLPEDEKAGNSRVVVLRYQFWQRRFGADLGLIGKTITLNGENFTVVGILPENFFFPGIRADIAIPLAADTDPWRPIRASTSFLRVFARLKPDVTREQAEADLNSIARKLQQLYPEADGNKTGIRFMPMHERITGDYKVALWVLLGAVSLVLLIACTNLANLLLARASTRSREVSIRAALGASQWRMIRQLLTESIILALAGGLLGFLLAVWGIKLLLALSPTDLPRINEIAIDTRVFLFTSILSLTAGLLFGLAPALQATRINLVEELKGRGQASSEGNRQNRVRSLLVISEIALSLVLLIGAGLLIKSFMRLQEINPGFEAKNVLALRLSLPRNRYTDREKVSRFYDQFVENIKRLPGVESVGTASQIPMCGLMAGIEFTIVGRPPLASTEANYSHYRFASPGYFQAMNIPILRGRDFNERDISTTPPVAVISKAMADRYWPNENPIGARVKIDDNNKGPREVEIVGVVGDVKINSLDEESLSTLYIALHQIHEDGVVWITNNMFWVIRSSQDPQLLAGAVKLELQKIDRDVPASSRTMEQMLEGSIATRRFNMTLFSIFSGAALLLALSGLYGLISYSVTQRRHEIGVRLALGAQPRSILYLIIRDGLKLILIGVGLGAVMATALTRIMSNLLYGISATDPFTFAIMPLILIFTALTASYFPARRAMNVDPMITLRCE
jgi:predicted permease